MLATFDLPAVRRFADELGTRRAGCNGEGMFCSDLDETLGCHFKVCAELLGAVTRWAQEIFSGRIAFDPEVELVFKTELQRALNDASPVVEFGRAVETECFSLERLDALERCVAHCKFLLDNWVSPQKSVAPAPRVTLNEATDKQIREQVSDLPPLAEDWRPKDRRQLRIFNRRPPS